MNSESREPGAMAANWSEMTMRQRIIETLGADQPLSLGQLRTLCWGDDDNGESTADFTLALSSLRGDGVVGVRGRYWGNAKRPYTSEYFLHAENVQ